MLLLKIVLVARQSRANRMLADLPLPMSPVADGPRNAASRLKMEAQLNLLESRFSVVEAAQDEMGKQLVSLVELLRSHTAHVQSQRQASAESPPAPRQLGTHPELGHSVHSSGRHRTYLSSAANAAANNEAAFASSTTGATAIAGASIFAPHDVAAKRRGDKACASGTVNAVASSNGGLHAAVVRRALGRLPTATSSMSLMSDGFGLRSAKSSGAAEFVGRLPAANPPAPTVVVISPGNSALPTPSEPPATTTAALKRGSNTWEEDVGRRHATAASARTPTPPVGKSEAATIAPANAEEQLGGTRRGTMRRRLTTRGSASRADFVDDDGSAVTPEGCFRRLEQLFSKLNSINEEGLLVSLMDFLFVVTAMVASGLAIMLVHPRLGQVSSEPHAGSVASFLLIEAFSAVWMGMRLFVRNRRTEWEVLDDLEDIRDVYIHSWFVLDCFYTVPIELAFLGWSPAGFHYASLRHLLRCVRVLSLGSSSNPLIQSRQWFRFASFVCFVALVWHCAACVYWSLENVTYVDSLWWALATMTTVGYGDVVPAQDRGRIFAILTMVTGVMMVSSLTAFATSFLTATDPLSEEQDRQKNMMHSMLAYYRVPWSVQKEIIGLFPSVLEKQSQTDFASIAGDLPAFMKSKLDLYVNAKLLRQIPIFASVSDDEMMLALSSSLQQRFFAPFENIVTYGDLAFEMFFLLRGTVEVTVPDGEGSEFVLATLRNGSWFGELALLEEGNTRQATVQSVTSCEVLCLPKKAFDSIVQRFPAFLEIIKGEQNAFDIDDLAQQPEGVSANGTSAGSSPVVPMVDNRAPDVAVTPPAEMLESFLPNGGSSMGSHGGPASGPPASGAADRRWSLAGEQRLGSLAASEHQFEKTYKRRTVIRNADDRQRVGAATPS